jgi:hypothetical protein
MKQSKRGTGGKKKMKDLAPSRVRGGTAAKVVGGANKKSSNTAPNTTSPK